MSMSGCWAGVVFILWNDFFDLLELGAGVQMVASFLGTHKERGKDATMLMGAKDTHALQDKRAADFLCAFCPSHPSATKRER